MNLPNLTIHIIPQSHIDVAWLWRYDPETIHVCCVNTLTQAFKNMEEEIAYTFTYTNVPCVEPMESFYPELFAKIEKYLKEGRFEIAGGLWLEIDGCGPCGESVVRQCLYGKRYYRGKFDIDVRTAWIDDAWTHPWTYPQILKKCGIDSYMFKRGVGKEKMFWWQSPDGSKIFAYAPEKSDEVPQSVKVWEEHALEMNKKYSVKDIMIRIGKGDHGGGPTREEIEKIKEFTFQTEMKLKFSTPTGFLCNVLSETSGFPVVNDELGLSFLGAYTTVGEIKRRNRQCENFLLTAEIFSSIAYLLDKIEYPQGEFNSLWKKVLLNQFHDTISGCVVPPAREDALKLYQEVISESKKILNNSLKTITECVHIENKGILIVVFNPLSWDRTDIVETELMFDDTIISFCHSCENRNPLNLNNNPISIRLEDNNHKQVPAKLVGIKRENGKYHLQIAFVAEEIPSMGYKVYYVFPYPSANNYSSCIKSNKKIIENEFFKIEINEETGCIKRIYDKKSNRKVLDKSEKGNIIQILEDMGDSEGRLETGSSEFVEKLTGRQWTTENYPEIELIEDGFVRKVLQIKKKFESAQFVQQIILYEKIPRIDFKLIVNWKGTHKMVKVAFLLAISSLGATYEIPYGTIYRLSEGKERPAQRWVDVSDGDYGVSLLNDSRYGYDVEGNIIRLSILRSPTEPAYNTDEEVEHIVGYSLYPHKGKWQESKVMQRGYEFNNPLLTNICNQNSGELPEAFSFIKIEPQNLIITTFKKAEDSNDMILRFYETCGKECSAKITMSSKFDAVYETDLLENNLREIESDGQNINIPVKPYEIVSLKFIRQM